MNIYFKCRFSIKEMDVVFLLEDRCRLVHAKCHFTIKLLAWGRVESCYCDVYSRAFTLETKRP